MPKIKGSHTAMKSGILAAESANEKLKAKTHYTEIQSQDIETFLNKKIGTKKVVTDYVTDRGTHLNNEAHKMVVEYLLSNKDFKKELEWK